MVLTVPCVNGDSLYQIRNEISLKWYCYYEVHPSHDEFEYNKAHVVRIFSFHFK
jgi:hypothetical protein